jgi:hypothetical protein
MRLGRWLFEKFDALMVRHQRKLTLVDTYGNVIIHRYCLLYREALENAVRAKAKGWPNVYLHNFIWEDSPDGPSSHSHAGTTLSWILKGEYWERYDGKTIHRKRWSLNRVVWPKAHKIERVKSGTWTIFVRWFVIDPEIRVVPETCETVCDYCAANYGQCFNTGKEFKYDAYIRQFDSKKLDGMKFPAWHYASEETDKFVTRRRRAMERMGRAAPRSTAEQLEVGRSYSKLPVMYDQNPEGVGVKAHGVTQPRSK